MAISGDSPNAARRESGSGRSRVPRRVRFHFSLGSLLLLMVIFSLAAAGLSYLVRAERGGGRESQLIFLLLVLVGPVALLTVVSLIHRFSRLGTNSEELVSPADPPDPLGLPRPERGGPADRSTD